MREEPFCLRRIGLCEPRGMILTTFQMEVWVRMFDLIVEIFLAGILRIVLDVLST